MKKEKLPCRKKSGGRKVVAGGGRRRREGQEPARKQVENHHSRAVNHLDVGKWPERRRKKPSKPPLGVARGGACNLRGRSGLWGYVPGSVVKKMEVINLI